tara:strand:- start:2175 stop:2603 length:429 start_codon:yes stop_codon:yes gene_type:complete
MSFPPDSALLTVSTGSAVSSAAAIPSLAGVAPPTDMVSTNSDSLIEGTVNNEDVPMGTWFTFIESQGGMPAGSIATLLALVGTMFVALIAYRSFQSIAATFIVTIGALAALSTMMGGVFPWWMVITFGLTGGVFVFSRRAYV